MPKLKLLLLDANVIIVAHELNLWHQLIDKCDITVTKTIEEQETYYWRDTNGEPHKIDLSEDIAKDKIYLIEVPKEKYNSFRNLFDPVYLGDMDPGETDALAFLYYSNENWLISSGDGIVYRILGRLGRGEQGISFEEILKQVGLGCRLKGQYTKNFRTKITKKGEQDSITGFGMK